MPYCQSGTRWLFDRQIDRQVDGLAWFIVGAAGIRPCLALVG